MTGGSKAIIIIIRRPKSREPNRTKPIFATNHGRHNQSPPMENSTPMSPPPLPVVGTRENPPEHEEALLSDPKTTFCQSLITPSKGEQIAHLLRVASSSPRSNHTHEISYHKHPTAEAASQCINNGIVILPSYLFFSHPDNNILVAVTRQNQLIVSNS